MFGMSVISLFLHQMENLDLGLGPSFSVLYSVHHFSQLRREFFSRVVAWFKMAKPMLKLIGRSPRLWKNYVLACFLR